VTRRRRGPHFKDAIGRILHIGDHVKLVGSRSNATQGRVVGVGRFPDTIEIRFLTDGAKASYSPNMIVKTPRPQR
jgi:hypothetical protein